jgi:hypothetical protein
MTVRSSIFLLLAAGMLAGLASLATARPAPWFKWRSKTDGQLVCSQTPLGAGWEKAFGPYQDSHCAKADPRQ